MCFGGGFQVCFVLLRDAGSERPRWGAAVHAAALVRQLGVLADQVGVEHATHLLDGLELGLATSDVEVLVEQRVMQPFHNAIGQRPA